MPFRSSKRESIGRGRSRSAFRANKNLREKPPPGSFPSKQDTTWTLSDSSMEHAADAPPVLSIETPPRQQHHNNKKQNNGSRPDDVSSIHVGESVSKAASKRGRAKNGKGRSSQRAGQGMQTGHSSTNFPATMEEADLLLDTLALADTSFTSTTSSKQQRSKERNKKGKYCLGKSKRSKSAKRREERQQNSQDNPRVDFRAHEEDAASEILIRLVSNLSLDSAGALASSAVGLSLLTGSPPKNDWNHPPGTMVRESLERHIQVCLDSSKPALDGDDDDDKKTACTSGTTTLSLPVDVDDVSFVKTDCQAVHELALLHLSEGEPVKALELFRVLLDNQRRQRGTGYPAAEESEIAKTKSKLAILSLLTKNNRDAWTYATSALQTHKRAAKPVHTTVSTVELALIHLGTENLSQALQCWREALQLACMTLGYENFQVAVLLANLGCLHYYMGNLSASLTALEESLGLQRQILRSNSQCANVEMPLFQMATTMGNLALILARCKNYEAAIGLMEESLAIQESVLPRTENVKVVSETYLDMFTQLRDDDTESIVSKKGKDGSSNNSICTTNSLIPKPVSIFGDSDGIPRRFDGSKHLHSSSSRCATGEDDLAYDCILLGSLVNPVGARQRVHMTVVQSLESAARREPDVTQFTSDDGATLTSATLTRKKQAIPVDLDGDAVIDAEFYLEEINLQALDHLSRNEIKDALDLFESALRSHKDKYGDIHHLVGTGLHNCGICHMIGENYIQGKLCFQEAVSVRAAALGDTHPDVAASKFKVGMIQMAAGDYECALSTFMDIIFQLQMNMSTYGFAPEAKMLNNIGVVLYEMGRDVDAFQSFFKAYQIQKGLTKDPNCSPAERSLASTLSNLAFIYAKQGQFSDSLGAYQEALGLLRKYHSTDHPSIVMIEENMALVRAYDAEESKDEGHVQSEVFASCAHLEKEGSKRIRYGQSRISACLPFPGA